jgi:hypothetical protein
MSYKQLTPRELIIQELLDESPDGRIHDVSTLRFLRTHLIGAYQVHCIVCSTTRGEEYGYICVLQYYKKAWVIRVMNEYNILASSPRPDILEDDPSVSFSMTASMTATISGPNGIFFAFARVQSEKFHVVRVRLEGSNAHFLEGFLEQGFVFFVGSEWIDPPLWVILYDETGACVKRVEVRRTIFG